MKPMQSNAKRFFAFSHSSQVILFCSKEECKWDRIQMEDQDMVLYLTSHEAYMAIYNSKIYSDFINFIIKHHILIFSSKNAENS